MIRVNRLLLVILIVSLASCDSERSMDSKTFTKEQQALRDTDRLRKDGKTDSQRRAKKVLEFVNLQPGMMVIDLEGGGGYFTELFSTLVGSSGKVYLQNTPKYLSKNGKNVDELLEDNRLPNVVRLDTQYVDLKLPNNIDLIFSSLKFHDLYVPKKNKEWLVDIDDYFTQLYNSLSENGQLIILDHSAVSGTGASAAAPLHRIDENFAISEVESRGFSLVESSDILRNSEDDLKLRIWKDKVRGKTDKFILRFKKIPK